MKTNTRTQTKERIGTKGASTTETEQPKKVIKVINITPKWENIILYYLDVYTEQLQRKKTKTKNPDKRREIIEDANNTIQDFKDNLITMAQAADKYNHLIEMSEYERNQYLHSIEEFNNA